MNMILMICNDFTNSLIDSEKRHKLYHVAYTRGDLEDIGKNVCL